MKSDGDGSSPRFWTGRLYSIQPFSSGMRQQRGLISPASSKARGTGRSALPVRYAPLFGGSTDAFVVCSKLRAARQSFDSHKTGRHQRDAPAKRCDAAALIVASQQVEIGRAHV